MHSLAPNDAVREREGRRERESECGQEGGRVRERERESVCVCFV
jgi:hypothetical protein